MGYNVARVGSRYEAKIYFGSEMVDGRRVPRRMKRVFDDEFSAYEWCKRTVSKDGHSKDMLFADWLDMWVESLDVAPSTKLNYESSVKNHLKPDLGHLKMSELTPTIFADYYTEKRKSLAPGTVRNLHFNIASSLTAARKKEVLDKSPLASVDVPRVRNLDAQPPTREQVLKLITESTGGVRRAIALAGTAGLRFSEVLGIRWMDVGEVELNISSQMWHSQRVPCKYGSERRVPLLDITRHYLGPRGAGGDLLVPLTTSGLWRGFHEVNVRVGTECNFHALRHSYATMLIAAGVSPKLVQEYLGHKFLTTTLSTYAAVIPTMRDEAFERMNQQWTPEATP